MAKKLSKNAPTESFLRQGEETAIRLALLQECVALAAPITTVTELVRAAHEKRRACDKALIPIRVKCSFADWEWDKRVRSMAKTADAQTGSKKSPAWRELFPNGLRPLVVPSGEGQRIAGEQLLLHLTTCTSPDARALVEEWKPKLQTAHDVLTAALAERKAAEAALFVARGEEQAAKRDFNRTIDKTIAEVRAIYPEDRALQDLAFPSLGTNGRPVDDVETEPQTPGAETEQA